MAIQPKKVTLRTYQVGFGDCFLFSVKYSDETERHMLIDFGTTEIPDALNSGMADWLRRIADDIKERCGSLDIVVATHRHKDHILGFSPDNKASGAGKVIADCKPKLVIQPWTEDPKLPLDAKKAGSLAVDGKDVKEVAAESYAMTLDNMQAVSASIVNQIQNLSDPNVHTRLIRSGLKDQIEFIGLDNVSNKSAVENLAGMGRNIYVYYGYPLNNDIKDILPGVKATVLGPPTIAQYAKVKSEAQKNASEFWTLQAMTNNFWAMQSATSDLTEKLISGEDKLFPAARSYKKSVPSHDRWFVRQLRKVRAEQLLGIATTMDDALNNTSLILLFEIGGKKFLFPGDAQIENWEYCLKIADEKTANLKLLQDTHMYKVGHHGSTNATPKTLWNNFGNKRHDGEAPDKVMTSVISTMGDENGKFKHGHPESGTEVPRGPLLKELVKAGEFFNTQTLTPTATLFHDIEFDV